MVQASGANTYGVAKFVVSADLTQGNYSTIQAAITAASAGDTVYVRTGSYTENITLKNGVNLASLDFAGGSGSRTKITGKLIDNGGVVGATLTNFTLQTNSDNIIALTGSGSLVLLEGCYINCTNNTGFSVATGTTVQAINCTGDLGTTGIAYSTGAGTVQYISCFTSNSGSSVTATTTSGSILIENSKFTCVFSTSSGGIITVDNSLVDSSGINTACITTAGTGSSIARNSAFLSGTASALSVGSGTTLTVSNITVNSSNTNSITGAGTINYQGVAFTGTSFLINTTTQTGGLLKGGQAQAPTAGFIGENITANVGNPGSGINNATATNVTSISLTAGVWDVTGIIGFAGATTGTQIAASINTTSATLGTLGFSRVDFPFLTQANSNLILTVPAVRLVLTTTTTVYLIAYMAYTVGTGTAYGNIKGVRVG